jgi:uncharacterized repeat protein (TIGR03803 family)
MRAGTGQAWPNLGGPSVLLIFAALFFSSQLALAQFTQQGPKVGTGAKAPKETILYNFQGGADGANPNAGVIFGGDGALYGTTVSGGTLNYAGTVYKLTPPARGGTQWTKTLLHSFSSPPDGSNPFAGVIFGSDGALYGTTVSGGNSGSGTVYKLTRPTNGGTLWNETVLYTFTGTTDGANPSNGSLIIDSSGALYGTTPGGGNFGQGTVYKLTPPTTGTQWIETVLYSFMGGADGRYGSSSLIFDGSGALYGTTAGGGNSDSGTVYKLTPPASGTVWNHTVLYTFAGDQGSTGNNGSTDGAFPSPAPLIFDSSGALYGTTGAGGPCQNCGLGFGTVYKLTPPTSGGTPWAETVLHFFAGASDGEGPDGGVIFDDHDALYGTTVDGGVGGGVGTVYKLTPPARGMPPGTPWTKTILHNFSMAPDGNHPYSGVIFDRHGAMYGTTRGGGTGNGTVFKVQ